MIDNGKNIVFAGISRDGSDGTRTRDLRRDRPENRDINGNGKTRKRKGIPRSSATFVPVRLGSPLHPKTVVSNHLGVEWATGGRRECR